MVTVNLSLSNFLDRIIITNENQKDLLVPGIRELIGGSQREERTDILLEKIEEFGLELEDYKWYVDMNRYGTNRHGGFGLGFERMVMYMTGMKNIRDVIPFPRTIGNLDF